MIDLNPDCAQRRRYNNHAAKRIVAEIRRLGVWVSSYVCGWCNSYHLTFENRRRKPRKP